MKKNILALVGLVIVLVITSCNKYDDEFFEIKEQPTQPTQKDSIPENNDTWETTKSDWFEMPTTETILSYKKTNLKDSYMVEVPFTASLGTDQYFSFDKKNVVVFKSLEDFISVTPSYGEWSSNEEGDSIRAITTNQNFDTNVYKRNLSITTGEAKRLLNGKPESFLMPTLSFSSVGTSRIDSTRIERNDSIFDRFTYRDSVVIKFVDRGTIRKDLKPYVVSSKTIIEYFVEKKEKNEYMPNPDITVGEEILSISDRTASPVYVSKTQINWYEVSLDKTSKNVYVIVNGKKEDVWSNESLANVDWCNSAMYDTVLGRWIPCHLAMDANGSGWSYTFQLADGTARKLDAPMNAALISSLKSFQEDDNAKQSPFLNNAAAVKRTFTDGVIYSVNGKYPYTVGYKF